MNKETILRRSDNVTFQTVAGEAILIRMDTGAYFSLNPAGTDFWELLDGRSSIAHIARIIADKYNTKSEIFAATLVELAKRGPAAGQVEALADEYEVELALVQGYLEELANRSTDEELAQYSAAIAREFYVSAEDVQADLLELAPTMLADKLVEIV
jgi:hypothetical protein